MKHNERMLGLFVLLAFLALAALIAPTRSSAGTGGTWETITAPMPSGNFIAMPGNGGAFDGKFYVFTLDWVTRTNKILVYDPATNTWAVEATLPGQFLGETSVGVIGDQMYIVGGCPGTDCSSSAVTSVYVYSMSNHTWVNNLPSLPVPVAQAQIGTMPGDNTGGTLWVAGGAANSAHVTNSLYMYNRNTNPPAWESKSPIPVSVKAAAAGIVYNKFYVAGGNGSEPGFPVLPTLYEYDALANAWATKSPMPVGVANAVGAAVDSFLYVVGGGDATGTLTKMVQRYDVSTDTWTVLADLPTAGQGGAAAFINGVLYVAGLLDSTGLNPLPPLKFTPPTSGGPLGINVFTVHMENDGSYRASALVFDNNAALASVNATWATASGEPSVALQFNNGTWMGPDPYGAIFNFGTQPPNGEQIRLTYVYKTGGVTSITYTLCGGVTQFASNLQPSGSIPADSPVTFTFAPVTGCGPATYFVQLMDNNGNPMWMTSPSPSTSVPYVDQNGNPLTLPPGTYRFNVTTICGQSTSPALPGPPISVSNAQTFSYGLRPLAVTPGSVGHWRDRWAANPFRPSGDYVWYGGSVDPDGSQGTIGTAMRGSTNGGLPYSPYSIDPHLFKGPSPINLSYDETVTSPWTLTFTNGSQTLSVQTPDTQGAPQVPFALGLSIENPGLTPTFSWGTSDGFTPDMVRISVYDLTPVGQQPRPTDMIHIDYLSGNTTTYTLPATLSSGYPLVAGHRYSFEVDLVRTRQGGVSQHRDQILSMSRVFYDFTPGPIVLYGAAHWRDNRGANSVGMLVGDYLSFGASAEPDGNAGTTGGASQGAASPVLTFTPFSTAPHWFQGVWLYNGSLTGPWNLTFTNAQSGGVPIPISTYGIGTSPPMPLVQNLTVSAMGTTPVFSWDIPAGAAIDLVRVEVWDLEKPVGRLSGDLVHVEALPAGTSTYTIPNVFSTGTSVRPGHRYAFEVNLALTRGGVFSASPTALRSISRTFLDFIIPAAAPIASAGPNQTVRHGAPVTLDGSGSSDPGGNVPLTYAWSFVSTPPGSMATLDNPSTVNPTFIADQVGDYVIQLVGTNSANIASIPANVTVSTYNTKPVADPGPDQAVTLIGSTVQLDGSQSYDDDGDRITYAWEIISKPAGSSATLSNTTVVNPTFVADVHGDYTVQLVVRDPWVASAAKIMTVSFTNVAPMANAGTSQSVELGDTAYINGSASTDANGDQLAYQWSFASLPQGSGAAIANPTAAQASFVPDVQGTYVVQLVVNDGYVNSAPATITVEVAVTAHSVTQLIQAALEPTIAALEPAAFRNVTMQNTLLNKLNTVIADVGVANYKGAVQKLLNDVLGKVDGVAATGKPDSNDWITDPAGQTAVYDYVMKAIAELKILLSQ